MDSQTPSPFDPNGDALAPETAQVFADLSRTEAHFRSLIAASQQQAEELRQARAEAARLHALLEHAEAAGADLASLLRVSQTEMARARVEEERTRHDAAQQRAKAEQCQVDAAQANAAAAQANAAAAQAREEAQAERARREAEQARGDAERDRTRRLEDALRRLHGNLINGDVYSLLLEASLSITGATRGVYVTRSGDDGPLRIRAAVDVDGYPQTPPSEFLQTLCRQVLSTRETIVAHTEHDFAGVPSPGDGNEKFHNGIAAPVALLKDLNGVIIAADKRNGDFDDGDVQSVVAVGNQAGFAAENGLLRRRLQEAYLSTVSVMADAMGAKDPYTQGHSDAVSRLARLTARHLNLSEMDRSVVCFAALLHDIGKIGVSDGLLNKPGPLLPEERELMRTHVRVGHDLIRHVAALGPVADAVLHHHEFYDGTGYPSGLSGDAIPVASRIVCVVDAYSAMISRRSYKEAYSEERARGELYRCSGTQFDPRVVEAFLYVLDLPDLEGHGEDEEAEYEWLPAFHVSRGQAERK